MGLPVNGVKYRLPVNQVSDAAGPEAGKSAAVRPCWTALYRADVWPVTSSAVAHASARAASANRTVAVSKSVSAAYLSALIDWLTTRFAVGATAV